MKEAIKILNASFSYGKHRVFENMNLCFNTKKITFLTGKSGIGETRV